MRLNQTTGRWWDQRGTSYPLLTGDALALRKDKEGPGSGETARKTPSLLGPSGQLWTRPLPQVPPRWQQGTHSPAPSPNSLSSSHCTHWPSPSGHLSAALPQGPGKKALTPGSLQRKNRLRWWAWPKSCKKLSKVGKQHPGTLSLSLLFNQTGQLCLQLAVQAWGKGRG